MRSSISAPRHLNLFLLGDAMKNKIGFQAMSREAARGLDQLLLLLLKRFIRHSALAVALHQFGKALRVSDLQEIRRQLELNSSFRNLTT